MSIKNSSDRMAFNNRCDWCGKYLATLDDAIETIASLWSPKYFCSKKCKLEYKASKGK